MSIMMKPITPLTSVFCVKDEFRHTNTFANNWETSDMSRRGYLKHLNGFTKPIQHTFCAESKRLFINYATIPSKIC